MGLKFPENLDDWRAWARRQNLPRYLKNLVLPGTQRPVQRWVLGTKNQQSPRVLVALEATTPTQQQALLAPGEYLAASGLAVAVLAPAVHGGFLSEQGYKVVAEFAEDDRAPAPLDGVGQVISTGNYLPVGDWAYRQAQSRGWGYNLVQHGLNTPFVPPLPRESRLFAFSEQDAAFWISHRTDIDYETVGSQIFYRAQQQAGIKPRTIEKTPIFLGQMHGAELSRLSFARASYQFSKNHSAIYRPHPAEKDKLSIMTHNLWAKKGIRIDRSGTPLNQINNPVVSIFSTGVLEAAIRGLPAWAYHPNPPAWLVEFWDRYGMSRWGSDPTVAPAQPEIEPAQRIAQVIATHLET